MPVRNGRIGCQSVVPVEDKCCKLIGNLTTELGLWFVGLWLALLHFAAGLFWIYTKAKRLSKLRLTLTCVYSIGLSLYPLYILVMHYYYGSYYLLYQSYFVPTVQCNVVGKLVVWCHFNCLFTVLMTNHHRYILIAYPFKDITRTRYGILYPCCCTQLPSWQW